MDEGIIASIVIGVLWVSVAIAATVLQKYVADQPRHKAEPRGRPSIPRQRESADHMAEVER